ncbi:TAXI family TRAP transporter solute-binding subunit [Sulfurospirillum sp. T05]|uniref:TAXI family TRAP transporter solute-binding subunit n=1 Tax=Sulfurospirillum tamanense TaxID=2813362 RepID=A0ABS2WU71_9BACT|nr:TAXI family TRAP transporter solute-binding subunit [Sulfurospirillum tamanensis]MBN2965208.1 TAXI family TRAP transporter solute-binding subunit [Sulfurospirillum tamanensis]
MISGTWFKRLLATSAAAAVLSSGALAEQKYIIATASTGGTFYPVGVGIATIASLKLAKDHKMTFSAISSAGSGENIDMMDKGEVNFSIIQGLFGSMAWQGKATYEGRAKKNLRSVTMLWQNVEHFTVTSDIAKTGNIMDLKNLYGQPFSISERNSGSRVSGEVIMDGLGIDYTKMNIQYLGYTPSATAMQDRKIKGMNTPAGDPVSAVTNTFASMGGDKIRVLDFTAEDVEKANSAYPVWVPYTIKAGTYPGQKQDINTIAQPNLLVVTEDTPEEVVYLLTKTIYENLPFLNSVHQATKSMALEKAIGGLPAPLHKGALRYYQEQGLTIPERLILN